MFNEFTYRLSLLSFTAILKEPGDEKRYVVSIKLPCKLESFLVSPSPRISPPR